jgi:hypothetical protein
MQILGAKFGSVPYMNGTGPDALNGTPPALFREQLKEQNTTASQTNTNSKTKSPETLKTLI